MGSQPQSVSNWTRGKNEPSRSNIEQLERVLNGRGRLLRAYGYDPGGDGPGVEDAILKDGRFTDENKQLLLKLIDTLAGRDPR